MTDCRAFIEVRSQHSKGSCAHMFGGPDTYIAIQIVPHGQKRLKVLNKKAATNRGIKIIYCGEGYSRHRGATSMLGQAIEKAQDIAEKINNN